MAMMDIEYRHADAPIDEPAARRRSCAAMASYLKDLVCEMQMADISCRFIDTVVAESPNTVLVNGRTVEQIIEGLQIKLLESDDSCDLGQGGMVTFGRPTLDWKRECIEDIPDTIMKNAIAKAYADACKDDIPLM